MTVRVTGTVAGLPVAPGDVTVTLPVYVLAGRSEGLTDTVMLPGTVPLVAESQETPPFEAVYVIPEVPPILTACGRGAAPPIR